jgi:hypothetical protein
MRDILHDYLRDTLELSYNVCKACINLYQNKGSDGSGYGVQLPLVSGEEPSGQVVVGEDGKS